jgi:hypothetical protein
VVFRRKIQTEYLRANAARVYSDDKTGRVEIKKQAIVGKQPENERKKYGATSGRKPFRCFVLALLRM